MKILHTADWHLGIKLHKKDLTIDHMLFFEWLLDLIKEREIDVLLISGDIFDQANPTNEARQLYYNFLKQLINSKCKVVITGGNHDSPGILNAPREILQMLDVYVIGNAAPEIDKQIIEIKKNSDTPKVVICAVPYLRDSDIRLSVEGESYETRIEQTRLGIKKYYDTVSDFCQKKYTSDIPIICMGHLFATGASTSESERDIQIGNLADFDANLFSKRFSYIALGHIHRPQKVGGKEHIRYSGSPIQLSFSEKNDKKVVIELEIKEDGPLTQVEHTIPNNRVLKKVSGSIISITKELNIFKNTNDLKAFAELEITEESNDPIIYTEINKLLGDFQSEQIEILKYKLTIKNQVTSSDKMFSSSTNIEDLNPLEILKKKLELENVNEENVVLIIDAFQELLQNIQESEAV